MEYPVSKDYAQSKDCGTFLEFISSWLRPQKGSVKYFKHCPTMWDITFPGLSCSQAYPGYVLWLVLTIVQESGSVDHKSGKPLYFSFWAYPNLWNVKWNGMKWNEMERNNDQKEWPEESDGSFQVDGDGRMLPCLGCPCLGVFTGPHDMMASYRLQPIGWDMAWSDVCLCCIMCLLLYLFSLLEWALDMSVVKQRNSKWAWQYA